MSAPDARPTKILAFGDSPTRTTGFARVMRNVLNLWQTMSDDLEMAPHIHCWGIGFEGWDYDSSPVLIFPGGTHDWNTASRLSQFLQVLVEGSYTHLFMLMDPDALGVHGFPQKLRQICKARGIRVLLYYPVDAPLEREWLAILDAADVAVTYTKYGQAETRRALGKKDEAKAGVPAGMFGPVEELVEDTAALLWVRLWIVLGYLARSTNRPGWLNAAGERQLNHAYRRVGGDGSAVNILTMGTVLRKVEDGWVCDLFAATNAELAGNFLTKEERGNRRSLVGRCKNVIGHDAKAQAELLPKDFFRKRDGVLMNEKEVDRSMIVIISIDRALKLRQRHRGTYTQGLVADAFFIQEATPQADLVEFYKWLSEVHDHPATPKSAEEVLLDFERLLKVSQQHG